jgi:hypothetical protein
LTAETDGEFPILPELRAAGMTDYVAMITPFAAEGIIGEMDGEGKEMNAECPVRVQRRAGGLRVFRDEL